VEVEVTLGAKFMAAVVVWNVLLCAAVLLGAE